jgi:hypothetical protein
MRWLGLSVALGLALSASAVVAQDTTSYRSSSSSNPSGSAVQFGLGGGLAIPIGTFHDRNKLGWQGMALVRFRPSSSPVGFQVDGNYMQMKFKSPAAGKTEVIDGTANIVFTIPTSAETTFKPYILGGAGIYNVKNKPDVGVSRSVTKFGLNGGLGFDIGSGSAVFFMEGRFHNVFSGTLDNIGGTSDASLIPVTIGIKFGGQ